MELKQLKEFYIKTGRPVECLTCGSKENLTVDHLIPKSIYQAGMSPVQKAEQHTMFEELRKNGDPVGYTNFAMMCVNCNQMKQSRTLKEFINRVFKIAGWIRDYDKNHPAEIKKEISITYSTLPSEQR